MLLIFIFFFPIASHPAKLGSLGDLNFFIFSSIAALSCGFMFLFSFVFSFYNFHGSARAVRWKQAIFFGLSRFIEKDEYDILNFWPTV